MITLVIFERLLEKREGENANGPWVRQPVLATTIGENPHKIVFTFNSAKIIETLGIMKTGDLCEVMFEPESREITKTDGTAAWVTDLRAWGMKRYATPGQ